MAKPNCLPVPNTWTVPTWPPDVWPHEEKKARTLIRFKKNELVRAGCLVRPGQRLVVLGPQYLGWLQKQSSRVDEFIIAPNRTRNANPVTADIGGDSGADESATPIEVPKRRCPLDPSGKAREFLARQEAGEQQSQKRGKKTVTSKVRE